MSFDKILVAILSFSGIIFTYWFFLFKKDEVVTVEDKVEITVDGGYKPKVIQIPVNKKTVLNFTRKDPSSCLEEIVLPNFKIKKYLPLNETIAIDLIPKKTGKFEISCGMNMFHGKIEVV